MEAYGDMRIIDDNPALHTAFAGHQQVVTNSYKVDKGEENSTPVQGGDNRDGNVGLVTKGLSLRQFRTFHSVDSMHEQVLQSLPHPCTLTPTTSER